jgi:hypothetical protein
LLAPATALVLFSFGIIIGIVVWLTGVFSTVGDSGCTGGVPVQPAKTIRRIASAVIVHKLIILGSMKSIA